MTRTFLDALFPKRAPLYFAGAFKGKPFIKQWSVLARATDDAVVINFFLELDPKPLGQGGPVLRERCQLTLDRDLRPVSYLSESGGARMRLDVAGDKAKAHMNDGTRVEVDFGASQFIVEANITGLDALCYAILRERKQLGAEGGSPTTLFLLNQLIPIPYVLTRVEGTTYRSSHDEDIVIDERGVLVSSQLDKAGVRIVREPAPPLPFWASLPDGTRPSELVRYLPPAKRTFELQDVSIAGRGGELAGTLTIPAGKGPFPAVLFLSGTGTHDRHGISGGIDIGTHEIVDHLAERGFVGLRFDTRGAGATKLGDDALDSSLTPLVEHARMWFAYLASRPEVDPKRIALLGHSQGGTVALLISTQDTPVVPSAIALLAAPGRPFPEILEEQIVQQSTELGMDDAARDEQLAEFREIVAAVKAGTKFEAGAVPDRLVPAARRVAWIRDHLDIDPVDLVPKLRCRLLVAQGAKDFQVSQRDAERLHQAAVTAGLDVAYALLPDLDHLFKHCSGKSTLEQYYDTTRHVDAGFLAKLDAWLVA